jgi:predicted DNA binding CopG/RHH family protein
MKKEYDFGKMKGRRNLHARKLKKQITIRLSVDVVDYFKGLAAETGVPYQLLIDLYLSECASSRKKPSLEWNSTT